MAGPDGHDIEQATARGPATAQESTTAVVGGPGIAELSARLTPSLPPAEAAAIVAKYSAERSAMMGYLARTAGNGYVQAVIAATPQAKESAPVVITSEPDVVRFEETEAGGASAPMRVHVSTTSVTPIDIESVEIFPSKADDGPPEAGEFIAWEPSSRKLQAGAPLTIDAQFHPARKGRLIAQLRLHGRSNGQPVQHQVRLVGIAAPAKENHRDQRESSVALMHARALGSNRVKPPTSTPLYTDMLASVYAARHLSATRDRGDEIHARELLLPVLQRLGELRPIAEAKLRQFGAGNQAGLTALSMSEAAIADWIQKVSLGSTIEPTHLVTEFEIGSETIRFLTGERDDAKDLHGFDHASRLVGLVAAGVTLGPPLAAAIGALIVTEAPLLAFAARMGLSRLLMWGATNPVVAVEVVSAFIGVGTAIDSWDDFVQALQNPREAGFLLMQVAMELAHIHQARASGGRVGSSTPHVDDETIHAELRARVQKLRGQLEAIETTGEPNPTAPPTRQQQATHEHDVAVDRMVNREADEIIVDPASARQTTTKPITPAQTVAFKQLVSGYTGRQATVQSFRANPVVGPQIAGLSDDEVIAIIGYTGSDYVEVNTALRSKDPQQIARMRPYVQMLQNALAKLPDHGGTVFRGAALSQSQVDRYVPGTVLEEEAFTSTSYDQGAKFGGNVEFEIRSRTGTRIDFLSRFPGEKEVLLAAGTRLTVVSKSYDATKNRWHILLEETP